MRRPLKIIFCRWMFYRTVLFLMKMETALAKKTGDVFTKSKRSEVMSRIRSRGNKDTEVALAKLLRTHKISGWRRHLLIRATVESSKLGVEGRRRRKLTGKELMVDRQKRRGPTDQLSTKNHQPA